MSRFPAFDSLSPKAQRRAIASVARLVKHMQDELIPALDRLRAQLRAFGEAARQSDLTEDPRERALRARRTRSTGPSRDPFTHRGTP